MTTLAIGCAAALAVTFVLWQSLGALVAWKLLYSDHHEFDVRQTPSDFGIDALSLTVPVDDQHDLAGWLITPTRQASLGGACIVMVHGFDSGKDKVWQFPEDDDYSASTIQQGAQSLWQAGFHVVAIDLRNHGESSDNGPVTLGARESDDVLATLEYLQANAHSLGIDPNRIGLRGESMGAVTCLIAAARDQQNRVAAVWSDSAFADAGSAILDFMRYKRIPAVFGPPARSWLVRLTGLDLGEASPIEVINQIDCPVLLTHSSSDLMLPISHLQRLASACTTGRAATWSLAAHQHNRLWREPQYLDLQVNFFKQHLLGEMPICNVA